MDAPQCRSTQKLNELSVHPSLERHTRALLSCQVTAVPSTAPSQAVLAAFAAARLAHHPCRIYSQSQGRCTTTLGHFRAIFCCAAVDILSWYYYVLARIRAGFALPGNGVGL